MPRTKEQFEAMREATREKIHSAAIKLFSQKGLSATGVQEIADTAGISVGLLYRHYKTKDEIFGDMVTQALDGLAETGRLFESDMPPVDVMRMFTEEILSDLLNSDEFVQYMMLLTQPFMMNQDFPWMRRVLEYDKLMFSQIARLIKRGQDAGQFKSGDPDSMAQYYFSIIQGVCMMKHFLKESYIQPTAAMMTAFLIKEESYEPK